MKTIKTLVLILAITFTSVLSASTNLVKEEPSNLAAQIETLLQNPNFIISNDLLAKVTFVLNKNNEAVVLNVETESSQLENYIKSRLNYSKLTIKGAVKGKTYVIPVRLTVE